ncbi:hypothetical protein AKJ65_03990 [candidate division MSBL1 archaeon SCGC-AAA259E19]|uniref:Uncharacterized protein n=1 Tax=candidate division MSBL1 archaeon SCGC-AAA259E19 TaxID=1698264 RepID=A0A133UK76_9EURY|nr:hypothetical protein AKJ65_03990 [candidate division MSBL1 archaeon SCGC-AAA259E19]
MSTTSDEKEIPVQEIESSVLDTVGRVLGNADWVSEGLDSEQAEKCVEYLNTEIDYLKKTLTLWVQVLSVFVIALSIIFATIRREVETGKFLPIFEAVGEYGILTQIFFFSLIIVIFVSLFRIIQLWGRYKGANEKKLEIQKKFPSSLGKIKKK